jgi:DNA-directed RNA polymerase
VPTEYESSLPVHQDGTCNGLQHYAALGGDDEGARQVNLSATDRPSDVYTHVADMVNKIMEEDIKKGHKVATSLLGKVSRKVVKQTVRALPSGLGLEFLTSSLQVMTTVYGVTFVGAREQIAKQLRDRKDIPEEECWGASTYLAKQVCYYQQVRAFQNLPSLPGTCMHWQPVPRR